MKTKMEVTEMDRTEFDQRKKDLSIMLKNKCISQENYDIAMSDVNKKYFGWG